ncbi:DoxX family protein [Pseudogemmobacter sp. W21_MBD1_M6]|jgi:putative oxidoreductase|uniref:DoxX family protein n=1 Tax=Pseudogemmobacter sp. W21_MBD1_M6 TaxID=3240271 RepID=UPI003F98CAD0
MTQLITLHNAAFSRLESWLAPWLLPSLARLTFAGVLLVYFWSSASTKIDGIFTLSSGAYFQIFPKAIEAAGYDPSQLSTLHWLVALAGTYAEYTLPALLVLGLFTRLAALGMIGFIAVQSIVDITGHMADAATIGAWFDKESAALILDQRAFWVFVLVTLVLRGAGPLSLDRILKVQ